MKQNLVAMALDDEPHALKLIGLYIERIPYIDLEWTTTSAWEAMELLKTNTPDILFLDIQMDEINGLQLLELVNPTCAVVITSAYEQYALKGYEYAIVDYLLKPFSFERFLKAVENVRLVISNKEIEVEKNNDGDQFFIKGDAKNKYHQVRFDDVIYVEGLKNYVQFICENRKIVSLKNMKDVSASLPAARFIRIHRSYIIQVSKIKRVEGHAVLIDDKWLPIGQTYRSTFYQLIENKGLSKM